MSMRALRWMAAVVALGAALAAAGCAGSKMDAASYERAVERQSQEEFQKRLGY